MNATTLKAGQNKRFGCQACLIEFEVTLEPKAQQLVDAERAKIDDQELLFSPFCADTDLEDLS